MPSPVTTPPLVFSRNTRPAPPVAMITELASTSVNSPLRSRWRRRPGTRPSSTTRSTQKCSSKRLIDGILDRGLEQRVQHVEAGLVGREPGALDLHAAEGAHVDVAIRRAAPWAAPVLELGQLLGAVGDEVLDHVLLAQPVAATHRVVEVVLEAVGRELDPRRAAFGRDRMAAHRVDLRDQRDLQRRIGLCNGDRCPQACPATADDHHIRLVYFHASSFLAPDQCRPRSTFEKPRRRRLGRGQVVTLLDRYADLSVSRSS
jgi:hypothetical protein